MKTTLTIEQSARLIELGVDPKKATSDHYGYDKNKNRVILFTIADLLELLPKEITRWGTLHNLNIDFPLVNQVAVRYVDPDDSEDGHFGQMCEELIDALYYLLVDGIEKEYITITPIEE